MTSWAVVNKPTKPYWDVSLFQIMTSVVICDVLESKENHKLVLWNKYDLWWIRLPRASVGRSSVDRTRLVELLDSVCQLLFLRITQRASYQSGRTLVGVEAPKDRQEEWLSPQHWSDDRSKRRETDGHYWSHLWTWHDDAIWQIDTTLTGTKFDTERRRYEYLLRETFEVGEHDDADETENPSSQLNSATNRWGASSRLFWRKTRDKTRQAVRLRKGVD